MPALKIFTADVGGTPISGGRAAQASDFAGADLGEFGQRAQAALGQWDERIAADDQRNVLVQTQELRARYAKELADAELSGAPIEPIQERFSNDQEQIAQATTTARGLSSARLHGSESSELFTRRTMEITATRHGAKVRQDLVRSDAASGQLLQGAPDMLPMLIENRNALVDTYAGMVRPEALAELKQEGAQLLAGTSVDAMIESEPAMALKMLQDPSDQLAGWEHLTPQQRTAAIDAAQTAVKAKAYDDDAAYRAAQRAKAEADSKSLGGMLEDLAAGKRGEWNMKRIFGDKATSPEMRQHMMAALDEFDKDAKYRAEHGKDATYAHNFQDLYRKIVAGTAQQDDVDAAVVAGQLDAQGHSQLTSALTRADRPEMQAESQFFSRAHSMISPRDMLGRFMAPDGEMNSYKFYVQMQKLREEWVKADKDPAELFDPSTTAYAQRVAPLLRHYAPKSLTVYGDNGQATQMSAQQAEPQGVVTNQQEYDAWINRMDVQPGQRTWWLKPDGSKVPITKPFPKREPATPEARRAMTPPAMSPAEVERGIQGGQELPLETVEPVRSQPLSQPLTYPPGFTAPGVMPGAEFTKPPKPAAGKPATPRPGSFVPPAKDKPRQAAAGSHRAVEEATPVAPPAKGLPLVLTPKDYDKLKPGQWYKDSSGTVWRKG